jgi:hypothetical protein
VHPGIGQEAAWIPIRSRYVARSSHPGIAAIRRTQLGSGLHPGWTFINTERQVYRFNPVAVTENLKTIYRGSRLLDIAETDLRRRHRPLQNLPYEEQMLEGLGAFDGAFSPGGGLVDSLSPPSLAK